MKHRKETVLAYLFIIPAFIFLGTFVIYPSIMNFIYAFTDFYLLTPESVSFVGLDNFRFMFGDPRFLVALKNTLYYVAVYVPTQILVALLVAVLMNQRFAFRGLVRTIIFSVSVLPMVAIANLWKMLVAPDGYFNFFLKILGLPPQPFLNSPDQAMNVIIAMTVWQGVGGQMILFLAGLQDIPRSLYEAAEVDGAKFFHKMIYITIPGLRNVLNFILVTTLIGAFGIFLQPYIMTGGGPRDSTLTIMMTFYETGFIYKDVGLAGAIMSIYFPIVLVLSLLQRKIVGEERQVIVE
ncbi:MAG: fructooligosaccharide transport system permease protein [Thermotogota bacterium]|nr:fructooligosaccharide transport system permease protein [Thermotogota bacterium]